MIGKGRYMLKYGENYIRIFHWYVCIFVISILGSLFLQKEFASAIPPGIMFAFIFGLLVLQIRCEVALDYKWNAAYPAGTSEYVGVLLFNGFVCIIVLVSLLTSLFASR